MRHGAITHDLAKALESTNRYQSDAANPQSSVWVNANAGTGKTYVLTLRVLRILLTGTPPERIVCLTYTKAAAAEMSKRIFDKLGTWVTASDEDLIKELGGILGRTPEATETAFARTLFTRAIETPGGLKIQTIHAFAEQLLQRFPLEASVPPGFQILDDLKGRDLKGRAIEATLRDATSKPQSPLGRALTTAIPYVSEASFDELLSKAIARRAWFDRVSLLDHGKYVDGLAAAEAHLRRTLGIRDGVKTADIETERGDVLSAGDLSALRDLLASGGPADAKLAQMLSQAAKSANSAQRGKLLVNYFLVEKGTEQRGSLMTKALQQQRPDLHDAATRAQGRFFALTGQLTALYLADASAALYRLAGAVLQRYSDAKAAAGTLDFDDLIDKTVNLLQAADQTPWVLFKMDGGLDHILVDEAQDTSPDQWAIIEALGREFFSGESARDVVRTVFAVGDEKQSIYSFQGARPEMFAEVGGRFEKLTQSANAGWNKVPLNLSFRTVQPVLDAVDDVFRDGNRTPGLLAGPAGIKHIAKRLGHAGVIEVWDVEKADPAVDTNPWAPLDDADSTKAPANRVANRIAATIAQWLASGEMLLSENRPIRAADILILVRKRNPFAIPMVAALKARGIAVAGSDRIKLNAQIVVQDLLTLGDFLTLPEDDLALAAVLKGPLFGLSDDDLQAFAHGRNGALWKAFLNAASADARLRPAAETLKRWRAKADFTPPFEFFSSLLDREGARSKFLHRLGPEAADAIDEFLDVALAYDDAEPPSLTGFLASLRADDREVKRDMDHARDEVRVMTVHGAKGLEAPIVFLPDTCTIATGEGPGTTLLMLNDPLPGSGIPPPLVWQVKGTAGVDAVAAANATKAERDREERNRLLYVAMTRARDRLYVAGFEGRKARSPLCWYDTITAALTPSMQEHTLPDGAKVWRIESPQSIEPEAPRSSLETAASSQPLPSFATRRADAEPQLTVPLAPSRLEPYAPDSEGEPLVAPVPADHPASDGGRPSPSTSAADNRFLRGTLTHALLQYLPEIAPAKRKPAATAFVDQRGGALSKRVRSQIVSETLAVMTSGDFAELFSDRSRAEVPVSAVLPRPHGTGPALRLTGQIDRLVVTDRDVMIVDFKTNRPPPQDVNRVAPAYLFQLAAYTLALAEIYPHKRVRAALLWTDGARLMEIPANMLRDYGERLWKLDVASLDAA